MRKCPDEYRARACYYTENDAGMRDLGLVPGQAWLK